MKKIIFMGTPQFAAEILQGLLEHASYQVIAVVTQPDRPVGRKRVLTQSPVKQLALAHDLPLSQLYPRVFASAAYTKLPVATIVP